jgi:hypothetical protein
MMDLNANISVVLSTDNLIFSGGILERQNVSYLLAGIDSLVRLTIFKDVHPISRVRMQPENDKVCF